MTIPIVYLCGTCVIQSGIVHMEKMNIPALILIVKAYIYVQLKGDAFRSLMFAMAGLIVGKHMLMNFSVKQVTAPVNASV